MDTVGPNLPVVNWENFSNPDPAHLRSTVMDAGQEYGMDTVDSKILKSSI